jgi:hypothetical protein
VREALLVSDQAIARGEDPLNHAYARWMCFMLLGDFARAWNETDRTEAARLRNGQRQSELPRHMRRVWDGTSLAGRRVLVRCFHGLGDAIQFSRFLPLLNRRAARVTLQCEPSLHELLESVLRAHEIVATDLECGPQDEPSYDCDIEIMELPYAFRTTLMTLPAAVPYLSIHETHVEQFRRLRSLPGLKVGLVWSSGDWNLLRNIPLSTLAPLGRLPGLSFVSLQRGTAAREILDGVDAIRFAYVEREDAGLRDAAAIISNLDLVIAVDTMVAHLAGALAKPTWLLLPVCADWRWMIDRDDSPWYPTMRLFRQTSHADWSDVVGRVAHELTLMLAAHNATSSDSANDSAKQHSF